MLVMATKSQTSRLTSQMLVACTNITFLCFLVLFRFYTFLIFQMLSANENNVWIGRGYIEKTFIAHRAHVVLLLVKYVNSILNLLRFNYKNKPRFYLAF